MAAQKYSLLSDTLSPLTGRDYLNLMALGLIMATMAYLVKITLTVAIIVLVSETSNRSLFLASLFASIPIVSILAIVWTHNDGKSGQDIAKHQKAITQIKYVHTQQDEVLTPHRSCTLMKKKS